MAEAPELRDLVLPELVPLVEDLERERDRLREELDEARTAFELARKTIERRAAAVEGWLLPALRDIRSGAHTRRGIVNTAADALRGYRHALAHGAEAVTRGVSLVVYGTSGDRLEVVVRADEVRLVGPLDDGTIVHVERQSVEAWAKREEARRG